MVLCKLEHKYKGFYQNHPLEKKAFPNRGILTKCLKFWDAVLFILTEKTWCCLKKMHRSEMSSISAGLGCLQRLSNRISKQKGDK